MLRSRSLFTSAGFCLLLGWMLLGVGLFAPNALRAQTVPGAQCATANGVVYCNDDSLGTGGTTCVSSASSSVCLNNGNGSMASSGASTQLGTGLGSTTQSSTAGASSGWLSQLTGWIASAIGIVFDAFVAFIKDMLTYTVGVVLALVAEAISAIGVPAWISQYSLGSLFGQTGAVAGFFMSELQVPLGLSLLGLGYAFRLTRKFLTLFQW